MLDAFGKRGDHQPNLDDLLLVRTAAARCGLSHGHLRHLIREGDVWGRKLDIYWYTTEQAVREYQSRNIKPGPKPK